MDSREVALTSQGSINFGNLQRIIPTDLNAGDLYSMAFILRDKSRFDGRYHSHLEVHFYVNPVAPMLSVLAIVWCTYPNFNDDPWKRAVSRGSFMSTNQQALRSLFDTVRTECDNDKDQLVWAESNATSVVLCQKSFQKEFNMSGDSDPRASIYLIVKEVTGAGTSSLKYCARLHIWGFEEPILMASWKDTPMKAVGAFFHAAYHHGWESLRVQNHPSRQQHVNSAWRPFPYNI